VRRGLALLLAALLGAAGCSSGNVAEKQAFLAAGREVKLKQPPPTHAELRKDLDLFLENDLLLTFDKAKAKERSELSTARIVFVGGMAAVVVGATAGSLKDNGGAQAAVIGAGAAAMAWSAWRTFGPAKKLHECQEFLSLSGGRLRQWEARNVGDSTGPVSEATWREYVNLVAEIQQHPSCVPVR
jgi:hypothetical protein